MNALPFALTSYAGFVHAAPMLMGTVACASLLGLELPRRIANVRPEDMGMRSYAKSIGTVLVHCAPEVVGLCICLTFALALRLRGDTEVITDPLEIQVWEQIKKDWPILMGADTLLNLQAMFRLIALAFVGFREKAGAASPISGTAAVLFLASMIARGQLATRTNDYRLEGPLALGGDLPIACEVAMVPRLAVLTYRSMRESPITATAMVSIATWYASFHYLNLAHDPSIDRLFTLAHTFEMLSAFAYLINTIVAHCGTNPFKAGPSLGFMHLLMPAQQALSAYYFLTSFEPNAANVGAGRPYCLLCLGNLLSLGAYLLSLAFYLGGVFDDSPRTAESTEVDTNIDTGLGAGTELGVGETLFDGAATPLQSTAPADTEKLEMDQDDVEQEHSDTESTTASSVSEHDPYQNRDKEQELRPRFEQLIL